MFYKQGCNKVVSTNRHGSVFNNSEDLKFLYFGICILVFYCLIFNMLIRPHWSQAHPRQNPNPVQLCITQTTLHITRSRDEALTGKYCRHVSINKENPTRCDGVHLPGQSGMVSLWNEKSLTSPAGWSWTHIPLLLSCNLDTAHMSWTRAQQTLYT